MVLFTQHLQILKVPERILWPPLSLVLGVEWQVNLHPLYILLKGKLCEKNSTAALPEGELS